MLTVLLIYVSLIFPIFLNIKLHLSKEDEKLYFNIKIFGVKIICGYLEGLKDGLMLHLTKKFAILIPYKKMFGMRKKVEILRDYHFIKINTKFNIGNQESFLYPLGVSFLINYFYNYLKWILLCKKPYIETQNVVNIHVGEDLFEVFFDSTVIFNLLMIFLSIIKIIVGKISYAITK